jgi:hypothetical protein
MHIVGNSASNNALTLYRPVIEKASENKIPKIK